jgi:hypothetical protein
MSQRCRRPPPGLRKNRLPARPLVRVCRQGRRDDAGFRTRLGRYAAPAVASAMLISWRVSIIKSLHAPITGASVISRAVICNVALLAPTRLPPWGLGEKPGWPVHSRNNRISTLMPRRSAANTVKAPPRRRCRTYARVFATDLPLDGCFWPGYIAR